MKVMVLIHINHGGINQNEDAKITIDFGREVEIDKLALVLRGDYPHDSFWTQISVVFQKVKKNLRNN